MKGILFTEFLEMVDGVFGPDTTEAVIEDTNVPTGGAYTAVGTYDHSEIVALVTALSHRSGAPIPKLVYGFGRYLLDRIHVHFPDYFADAELSTLAIERLHALHKVKQLTGSIFVSRLVQAAA